MFGMGGSEIIVILIVALLFLGPDKLPEAAKQISKGIRDIKKQSRTLQQTIENDERIGGAIRDIKSALRGEDEPYKPPPKKKPKPEETIEGATATAAIVAGKPEDEPKIVAENADKPDVVVEAELPKVRMAPVAGEADPDTRLNDDDEDAELAAMIKPAAGIARSKPAAAEDIAKSKNG